MKKWIAMKDQRVTAGEMLALIPEHLHKRITDELAVDKWVPKLKANFLFKLLIFSLLQSKQLSLRVIEENSHDKFFLALGPDLFEPVSYGAVRHRLINVRVEYFQKLYEHLYQVLQEQYCVRQLARHHLKLYDSTLVAVFSHLLEGMRVGNTSKNKQQVKFTTELTDSLLVKVAFFKDQAHLSEHTALKQIITGEEHTADEIIVFDSGLQCRKTFAEFDDANTQFVTRGRNRLKYELLETLTEDDRLPATEDLKFIQDSLVYLFADGGQKINHPFRLVEAERRTDHRRLLFLTNIKDLPPDQIAYIYKQRWDIEVFFKFMKQEMNLTHFVCHDENAIKVMLYCTLIASMLVLAYKQLNRIESFKIAKIRFFKELHVCIIGELLDHRNGIKWLKQFNLFRLQRE